MRDIIVVVVAVALMLVGILSKAFLLAVFALLALPLVFLGFAFHTFWASRRPVSILVDERGLSIGDRLSPWAAVKGIWTLPGDGTSALVRGRRAAKLRFSTVDDARAIVEAAVSRISVRPRSMVFTRLPVQESALLIIIPTFLACYLIPRGTEWWGLVLLCSALGVAVLRRILRVHVNVGCDGLCARVGAAEKFIPFASVESIQEAEHSIRLTTKDGSSYRWVSTRGHSAQSFAQSLEVARQRDRSRREERATSGRPSGGQVTAGVGVADYRNAAYPIDVVLRIAEDPTEDVGTRLTAIRALRARAEPIDLSRVRVAAAQTASTELRVCLEDLAADEAQVHRIR